MFTKIRYIINNNNSLRSYRRGIWFLNKRGKVIELMREEVVLVSGVRTAVGKFGRAYKDVPAVRLGAIVVEEAIKRAGAKKRIGNSLSGWRECCSNDC